MQEWSILKHAPKIFAETCKIDWTKTVGEVHNLIRGLSPFPGAFTYLNDKVLKIYKSRIDSADIGFNEVETTESQIPDRKKTMGAKEGDDIDGTDILRDALHTSPIKTDGKTFLKFACTDGYIEILELQLEGRKKMKTEEFLRGYSFE